MIDPDMTPNILLVIVVAGLVSTGVYLMLERSLTRIMIGIVLVSNGINVLFLVAGGASGGAPIVGSTPTEEMSDPLPQAMVLTAIVITLGMTAFVLAMAYRSWQLHRHDEVQDDLEDRRIASIAAANQAIFSDSDTPDVTSDLDLDAVEARDETGEGRRR
ncbi:Na(+)/H(+) antiporter subunit C [Cellulomonas sp. ATA003]|uniref:Na(+)/H(+) antiporter subunit C n=1 Tax=Cellulomonas sp. ATA003 TaxID=3073064 RepID=UPI002872C71F|nr:Na(+)/H(+) antiporter subunit C [Cellulomonas sp. ATA003]WNB85744.1 Na(+)/H(+) antiporter subunit C [Cellulomonas sp. ATA003]